MKFNRIKETCLYVKDLKRTRAFYEGKLGLEVITEVEKSHVFFRAGESVLLCFLPEASWNNEVLPPHAAEGVLHYAFECEAGDYEKMKKDFIEKGIEITCEYDWPKGRSFYFNDPDGHVGEVVTRGMWD